ncbi:MAG: winged helix-turn-helix transcriptional regulator [Promethearchaeia archaeon]
MSLEKEKPSEESEEKKEKEPLNESQFRKSDLEPLGSEAIEKSVEVGEEDIYKASEEEPSAIDAERIKGNLTEIEKEILDIAEDILKLNRYDSSFDLDLNSAAELQHFPIIEKLYAKSIGKLAYNKGYSKRKIFLTIRDLEEKNYIVSNERRTKLEILNNEKLSEILDFIKKHPGIHARDEKIEKELDITRTPFLKHIMTLERFELIRSKKIGRKLHYFLADVPEEMDEFKAIFLDEMNYKIIKSFIKDETTAISTIAKNLDVYPGTVQYHIKKLKKLDLIKSAENESNNKIYLVNLELLKTYNEIFQEPDFSNFLMGL